MLTTSPVELHLQKAEALRELARRRLQPPERDRIVALIGEASENLRRAQNAEPVGGTDMLRNAEEKLARAEADRDEKRRPYEADPLFMYLWRRRFGTRDYKAGGLVRYFDRKVAHLIGYENARVNYTMLMELPDRLREHVERQRQNRGASPSALGPDVDALVGALAAIEQRPEIAAMIRDARGNPGADEALVGRLGDIDRDLATTVTTSR